MAGELDKNSALKIFCIRLWRLLRFSAPLAATAILALFLLLPEDAGAEWKYTVKALFRWAFPPLAALAVLVFRQPLAKALGASWLDLGLLCLGGLFISIPLLGPPAYASPWLENCLFSVCWFLGAALVCAGLFSLGAKARDFLSWPLCILASLALAFACGEAFFLFTSQPSDGLWENNGGSQYVLAGQAQPDYEDKKTAFGQFPAQPRHPSHALAQMAMKFDKTLFDVRYTFNAGGHRVLPPAMEKPEAELLLFGCSFTFGHGLNDEETWAWRLAEDLGPGWKLENYAYNGFGAHQMLTLLEEGRIDPPKAQKRYALFLAIADHLRRNEAFALFPDSIIYRRNGDRLERAGKSVDSPNHLLSEAETFFNGSQLAREFTGRLTRWLVRKNQAEYQANYLAIIRESARILRERYQTELIVLLWPDFEFLAPELEKIHVPCLLARGLLRNWRDNDPGPYQIAPGEEAHPNQRATAELAAGLGRYFRQIAQK